MIFKIVTIASYQGDGTVGLMMEVCARERQKDREVTKTPGQDGRLAAHRSNAAD